MPVYLVTDSVTAVRTMVEAARPAGALSALIDARFDVSPALDATDALKLISQGVPYLAGAEGSPVLECEDGTEFAEVDEAPAADTRPSLDAFVAAADADDDEAYPDTPASGGWSTEADEVVEALR